MVPIVGDLRVGEVALRVEGGSLLSVFCLVEVEGKKGSLSS